MLAKKEPKPNSQPSNKDVSEYLATAVTWHDEKQKPSEHVVRDLRAIARDLVKNKSAMKGPGIHLPSVLRFLDSKKLKRVACLTIHPKPTSTGLLVMWLAGKCSGIACVSYSMYWRHHRGMRVL